MDLPFIIDIDDTLLISEKEECPCCGRIKYTNAKPIQSEIDNCNKLYYNGSTIILYTGRKEDCRAVTERQLESMGIKYHLLEMNKREGIYIDATNNYRSLKGFI